MTREDAYDTAKTVATRWAADRIYQWQLGRADRDDRDRLAARWGSSIAGQVLDAVYDTIHDEGVRAGREQAAQAIRTRADEIQVDPTDYASLNAVRRRTLRTAANIAAAPMTLAEAAQAFTAAVRDGTLVVCNLDDAGRAIEPHGTVEAPSAALEHPTGAGAGAEPHEAATEAPRGAETITGADEPIRSIVTWDYAEQPDVEQFARALHEASGGTMHAAMADTGSDQYALVIANQPLDEAGATAAYWRWCSEGTAMPDPLADLTRLARERWEGHHADAHLRVAPDVRDTMREAAPPKPHPLFGGPLGALVGLQVVVDEELPAGHWRLVGNRDREFRQGGFIYPVVGEASHG